MTSRRGEEGPVRRFHWSPTGQQRNPLDGSVPGAPEAKDTAGPPAPPLREIPEACRYVRLPSLMMVLVNPLWAEAEGEVEPRGGWTDSGESRKERKPGGNGA